MDTAYLVVVSRPYEISLVAPLCARLGPRLIVGSHLEFDTGAAIPWKIDRMGMGDAEWSARILRRFLETGSEVGVKIDPDTSLTGDVPFSPSFDVWGDFRRSSAQPLVWMGGYQAFTRSAAEELLPKLKGPTLYQDFAMGRALVGTKMAAYNHPQVNAWAAPGDLVTPAFHRGRPPGLRRHPLGSFHP